MSKHLEHCTPDEPCEDCAVPESKEEKCDCPTKYCKHYESDFERFVKENPLPNKEAGVSEASCPIPEISEIWWGVYNRATSKLSYIYNDKEAAENQKNRNREVFRVAPFKVRSTILIPPYDVNWEKRFNEKFGSLEQHGQPNIPVNFDIAKFFKEEIKCISNFSFPESTPHIPQPPTGTGEEKCFCSDWDKLREDDGHFTCEKCTPAHIDSNKCECKNCLEIRAEDRCDNDCGECPTSESWEERFDKNFINLCSIIIPIEPRGKEFGNHKLVEKTQLVKDFIRTELSKCREEERTRLLKKVEGMKKQSPYQKGDFYGQSVPVPNHIDTYNSAISDVLSLISNKE